MEHLTMAENEVLTRDAAIPERVLPTGRKLGVLPVKGAGMFTIHYVDGKPGMLPEKYSGRYTGLLAAEDALEKFLHELWDVSDSATKKKPVADAVRR
jgi:hypothetical protein